MPSPLLVVPAASPRVLTTPRGNAGTFHELLASLSQTLTQLAKVYHQDLAAASLQNDSWQSKPAEQKVEMDLQSSSAKVCEGDLDTVLKSVNFANQFDKQRATGNSRRVQPKVSFQALEQAEIHSQGTKPTTPRTSPRISSISLSEEASNAKIEHTQSTTVESAAQVALACSSPEENAGSNREGSKKFGVRSTAECIDVSDSSSESSALPPRQTDIPSQTFYFVRTSWSDTSEFDGCKLVDIINAERFARTKKVEEEGFDARLKDVATQMKETEAVEGSDSCRLIVQPESRMRGFWVLTSMAFLIYDMVFVPINVCFSLQPTTFSNAVDTMTVGFWTADMILTFFTGVRTEEVVESRPTRIACIYFKSWFLFDFVLVMSEWVTVVLNDADSLGADVSILRMLRWGRLMRLLRMARILRLRLFMRRVVLVFNLSKVYVHLTQGLVGLSALLVVFIHMLSCFWYALGNMGDDGWVNANDLKLESVADLYIVSVHWSFSRLHGLRSNYILLSHWEMLLDAMLIYISLMLVAYYNGMAAAMSMTRAQQKQSGNLWKLSLLYVKRHKVSPALGLRLFKYVESVCFTGANDTAEEEMILLQALPSILKEDLLFEARARSLLTKPFFSDMFWDINPRVVRHICSEAMALCVFVEGEVIFAHGDVCHRMLFLVSGNLQYIDDSIPEAYERSLKVSIQRRAIESITAHKVWKQASMRTRSMTGGGTVVTLSRGSSLSEPVLWTEWAHVGRLVSVDEATSLSLDPMQFANVVVEHKGARGPFMHAARYAKHFVWHLNHSEESDDLTSFTNLTIDELDMDLFEGSDLDHFMFISHYKVEAGTEATLMGELFADILRQDPSHPANDLRSPIFIDSEDLTDLALLRQHVENTTALVLLLTPGVLSRPWCLVEIVTAVVHAVDIVPVEIQRPGSAYRYPNEEFYADLQAGKFLNQASLDLLENEGIELQDVERAIRQVFLKIALPFSPHKTKAIREAELTDILKRCSGDSWMKSKSTLRKSTSGNGRRLSARLM